MLLCNGAGSGSRRLSHLAELDAPRKSLRLHCSSLRTKAVTSVELTYRWTAAWCRSEIPPRCLNPKEDEKKDSKMAGDHMKARDKMATQSKNQKDDKMSHANKTNHENKMSHNDKMNHNNKMAHQNKTNHQWELDAVGGGVAAPYFSRNRQPNEYNGN